MAHLILNYLRSIVTETNQLIDSYISGMISSKMTYNLERKKFKNWKIFLSIQFYCYIYNNVKRFYLLICILSQNYTMIVGHISESRRGSDLERETSYNFYLLKNTIEFFALERRVFRAGQTFTSEQDLRPSLFWSWG